ncbi:F-box family protein [Melia azedarach]|uniref:F-box family protein n=1 Tax=Melia azedarach TaxID=155640 RepID=A0ACC1XYU1_MELAZ|nr:F-box family protein [Melia azedarach]
MSLTFSDTDSETSFSDDEPSTMTTELDDVASVTQQELTLMSSMKRVFKEVGSFADDDCRLLTVAVHAVMLHYGFVCFVPESQTKLDSFNHATTSSIHITYTLPEVLELTKTETLTLSFQDSGNFVNVRGFLTEKEPVVHQLSLNRSRFAPPLDLTFVDSDMIDQRIKLHGSSSDRYPENEVFEFRRLVNDALVYPLLIDIRQKVGLLPPPCFMRLPAELKLKILELLDGVDVARAACVCTELRNLSVENDDLWRRKCTGEVCISREINRRKLEE